MRRHVGISCRTSQARPSGVGTLLAPLLSPSRSIGTRSEMPATRAIPTPARPSYPRRMATTGMGAGAKQTGKRRSTATDLGDGPYVVHAVAIEALAVHGERTGTVMRLDRPHRPWTEDTWSHRPEPRSTSLYTSQPRGRRRSLAITRRSPSRLICQSRAFGN